MRVAIHQPQFLPYPGFFHKLSLVDAWVVMDDVQYDKRFTNRNRILAPGGPIWLTIPIMKFQKFDKNMDVMVNNSIPWKEEHWKKLTHSYKNARWFETYGPYLDDFYKRDHELLFEVDFETTKKVMEWLGIRAKIIRESELGVNSGGTTRLVEVTKAVGGDTYVSGRGGHDYMDEALFARNGLRLEYQNYKARPYKQRFLEKFVPDLSVIDLLFNLGPASLQHITGAQGMRITTTN